jgi:hypothetical protein
MQNYVNIVLEEYLEEYETRIRENLIDDQFQIERLNDALVFFTWLLNAILAGADKPDLKRYWAIDTLWCTGNYQEGGKIFACGTVYWLEGGKQCKFFEAEIEVTERAINYVFTFTENAIALTPNLIIASNETGISVETEFRAEL